MSMQTGKEGTAEKRGVFFSGRSKPSVYKYEKQELFDESESSARKGER